MVSISLFISSHLHTKKRSENSTIQKTTIHSTNSNRIMLIFGMIEHNNIIIINTRERNLESSSIIFSYFSPMFRNNRERERDLETSLFWFN